MSNYILPIVIFCILIYSINKCDIYESFLKGAKEGIEIGISIFPSIIAIIFSSRIFISSGLLDFILKIIKSLLNFIPIQIFPMIILRPISFNASLSIMIDIFSRYGVDSYLGNLSSVIQGCMDTTFYIISLYLGVIGIKKIKYTLYLSLLINIIGVILSILLVNLLL